MIQFLKFKCITTPGVCLIRVDKIIAILPTDALHESCIHLSTGSDFVVAGSVEFLTSILQSLVGVEWDAVPEDSAPILDDAAPLGDLDE